MTKGVTLNVNWYRRSQYQQTLVLNYAESLSDWTPLTITNPLDGSPITFYNLGLSKVPTPAVWQTNAPQSLVKNVYTGYEASVVARPRSGMFVVFGWTIDRDLNRSCAMSAGTSSSISGNKLNDPNTLRFCDWFGGLDQNLGKVSGPAWASDFKVQAVIPLHWGIGVSAGFGSSRVQGGFASGAAASVNKRIPGAHLDHYGQHRLSGQLHRLYAGHESFPIGPSVRNDQSGRPGSGAFAAFQLA